MKRKWRSIQKIYTEMIFFLHFLKKTFCMKFPPFSNNLSIDKNSLICYNINKQDVKCNASYQKQEVFK